jgi:hypothetical protein
MAPILKPSYWDDEVLSVPVALWPARIEASVNGICKDKIPTIQIPHLMHNLQDVFCCVQYLLVCLVGR